MTQGPLDFHDPETVFMLVNPVRMLYPWWFSESWLKALTECTEAHGWKILEQGEITITRELVEAIFNFREPYRGDEKFRENAYSLVGQRGYGFVIRGDYASHLEDHFSVGSPYNADFTDDIVYTRPYTGQSDDEDDLLIEIFRAQRLIETQPAPKRTLTMRLLDMFAPLAPAA